MAAAVTESASTTAVPGARPVPGTVTGVGLRRPRPAAQVATWTAALLATASVPLHAWMLAVHSHGIVLTVLMAVMALWCLWCAVGTARRASVHRSDAACSRTRALRHLWVMAGAMALLHVGLLTGALDGGGHHGDHDSAHLSGHESGVGMAADAATTVGAATGTGTALMLAIVALELAVCFACAVALRARPREPRVHSMPLAHRNAP